MAGSSKTIPKQLRATSANDATSTPGNLGRDRGSPLQKNNHSAYRWKAAQAEFLMMTSRAGEICIFNGLLQQLDWIRGRNAQDNEL